MEILALCRSFFDTLNSDNVRYCHWKSNTHLDKALRGETDLDILVHLDDKCKFDKACEEFDFKIVLSPSEKRFPGMTDYLGFDPETGCFVHLHVHLKLILGQKYIKNYHLPLERFVFEHLTIKDGVKIPIPALELLLLIIRAHMKMDLLSLVKLIIRSLQGQYYCPFPEAIEKEFNELIGTCSMSELKDILIKSNLPLSVLLVYDFIEKFSSKEYKWHEIINTEIQVFKALKLFKREYGIMPYLKYCQFCFVQLPGVNRVFPQKKKTIPTRGKIFSLVGADGSGKSTLYAALTKWLTWKLSVKGYYYGIPKNFFVATLDYGNQVTKKLRLHFFSSMLANILWVYVARNRYKIFQTSTKNASDGEVVLTDRFPLKDFITMKEPMDGARLKRQQTKIGQYFSRIESDYYTKIQNPNCLLVLQVELDELRRRKTDLSLETHAAKAVAINEIQETKTRVLIDANQPYVDVELEIKRAIWEYLWP